MDQDQQPDVADNDRLEHESDVDAASRESRSSTSSTTEVASDETRGLEHASHSDPSDPFVGRWNRLVSTTNWEKGRIIHEWRAALIAVNAPVTEYSDEMWSQIVGGNVSGQHAGRLRRVYERFGDVHDQYTGLYWSHFQAALDWDDAEMWLEGAIQKKWSVAAMRKKRWETCGAVAEDEPRETDVVAAEVDEDFSENDAKDGESGEGSNGTMPNSAMTAEDYVAEARSPAGPDFGDEDDSSPGSQDHKDADSDSSATESAGPIQRPLANLPPLPEDLSTAFEAFQLAILRHKSEAWAEVSCDDVLTSLDALKSLALAASE